MKEELEKVGRSHWPVMFVRIDTQYTSVLLF